MLENSLGYKGPIPRISYSRYFSIENVKVSSDGVDKKITQESERSLSKMFCERDKNTPREYGKLEQRKKTRTQLLKYGAPNGAGSRSDTCGKTHVLPAPTQKVQTPTKRSSREKLHTGKTREDVKPLLEFSRDFCSCRDIALFNTDIHERVCLKFDNEFHLKQQQRMNGRKIPERPSSVKSDFQDNDEEMQREKIIDSWMQFFG